VTELAAGSASPTRRSTSCRRAARRGLLTARCDGRDKRRRLLALSPRGAGCWPAWCRLEEIRAANAELFAEAGSTLLGEVDKLERLLDQRSMYQRVRQRLQRRQLAQVKITVYRRACAAFKALNVEWLEKYFTVEQHDLAVLNDPDQMILGKGGKILFASLGGRIAGTCASCRMARSVSS